MQLFAIRRSQCLAAFYVSIPLLLATRHISAQSSPNDATPASAPTTTSAPVTTAPTTPTPTSAKAPELPTVESIQSRIKLVQEQTSLDDGTKSKIVEIYNQAIADLGRAEEWNARIAEFQKQQQEAPGTIEEMTRMAAEPIPDPDVNPDPAAKLSDYEKQLAEAETKYKTWAGRLASLDGELKGRDERLKAIADLIAKERKELEEVSNSLANPAITEEPPERAAAKRVAWMARAHSLGRELEGLNLDLERTDFLTAMRDYTAREAKQKEKVVKKWQEIVNERRRAELDAAAQKAKEAEKEAEKSHAVVANLARENSTFVEDRKKVVSKIEDLVQRKKNIETDLKKIADRQSSTKRKVDSAGMSQQLATVLRRYREQLPNIRELRQKLVEAQQELKDAESKTIVLDDTREAAKELEAELNARMLQVEPGLPKKTREAIRAEVTELLKSRKKYIQDLWTDYNNYLEQLGGTDGLVDGLQARLDTTESFAAFINEHIFWAKSTTLPNEDDKKHLVAAFRWLTSPTNWAAVGKALVDSARLHVFESVLAGLFLLAVVLVQPRVRSSLRSKGATVSKSYAAVFAPTVEAFLLTLFAAITLPLFFWTLGWLISLQYGADEFVRAVERALQVLVIPVFSIELLRHTCRPQGLGEAHYNWPTKIVRLINRSCWLLIVIGVPLGVVAIMIDWTSNEHWQRSLGRLAFCFGQCLMSFVLWRVLRPKTGVLAEIPLIQKGGWQARFGKFAFAVMVIAPLILLVISIFGYHYTAVEIASRFNRTLWLLFSLIILYGLGLRWLLVSRRKLAIEQARQRRAAQEAKQLAEAEKDSSEAAADGKAESRVVEAPPEPEIDISSLNEQTRAILRALTIIGFVIVFWTVWADVIPALRIFDDVQLWSAKVTYSDTIAGPDGQPRIETSERMEWITLTDLFASILYLLAAVISIRNLPGLLEIGIYRRMSLGAGERYALTTILKYVITILGVLFAFGAIGIGWAQVQWLAAAMTVGLGFGLQEIFANFVSGLILLFERPIRVGDIVTVGGVDGRVTRIQMRATTILNWERKELIVPNKEFVTGQVMNWTLTDEVQRILIQVGVAYGSDTRKVKDLLTKVVTSHAKIIKDPAHRILFKGFGASTLDFEVVAFVEKSDDLVPTRDDLYYAIDDAFREASIEIAFPQLDIHVRNVPKELHGAAPANRSEAAQ